MAEMTTAELSTQFEIETRSTIGVVRLDDAPNNPVRSALHKIAEHAEPGEYTFAIPDEWIDDDDEVTASSYRVTIEALDRHQDRR